MNILARSSLILVFAACSHATAGTLKQAYLDEMQNVHVVTSAGLDLKLTASGQGSEVKLSPDGDSVAWLVRSSAAASEESGAGSSKLAIYHHGSVRTIECGPYVRDYWFWMKGRRVAIDCGGRHFAGREILYDVNTLRVIASFDQAIVPVERRPAWSSSSERFDEN